MHLKKSVMVKASIPMMMMMKILNDVMFLIYNVYPNHIIMLNILFPVKNIFFYSYKKENFIVFILRFLTCSIWSFS